MNTKDWLPYYKQAEFEGGPITTQMCYTPLISPNGKLFCMDFTYPSEYQTSQGRISYTEDFVDLVWNREIEYLEKIKYFDWAPEIVALDNHKIFIKWYGGTCNDLVYGSKDLEEKYPDWRSQIFSIILDQVKVGILKPTVYPHSHYFDNTGKMHAIDFYACVEKGNTMIPYSSIESMIGSNSRFDQARKGDMIDVEEIFKSGLKDFSKWPGGLEALYYEIYT